MLNYFLSLGLFAKTLLTLCVLVIGLVLLLVCSISAKLFVVNQMAAFKGYQQAHSLAYGALPEQILDVYMPRTSNTKKLPVVVFFYGGCWGACSTFKKGDYGFVAEAFSSNNMLAVVADYRLYPQVMFPSIIEDAASVVTWVENNIANYGGDPTNIYLMGHSAGAHIGSMLVVNKSYLPQPVYKNIRGFIGLAGPYDFLPFDEDYLPLLFGKPMQEAESQPVNFVDGSEPPFLLMHGAEDFRVKRRNIEGMTKKIKEQGGDVESHLYPGIDHGSIIAGLSVLMRDKKPMFKDIQQFIARTLKSPSNADD